MILKSHQRCSEWTKACPVVVIDNCKCQIEEVLAADLWFLPQSCGMAQCTKLTQLMWSVASGAY